MSDEPRFQDVIVLTEVSDHFGCHLRIWERGNRTIVVAGQLKNLYVPQSRIEQCVDEIARIFLPQAREFEFYTYDPGTLDEYAAGLGRPFQAVFFDVACPRRRGTALTTRIYSAAGHAPEEGRPAGAMACAFSNPRWGRYMTPGEFREHTGVNADEFPADLYTPDAVRAYLDTGVNSVPWDPYRLKLHLAQVRSLDAAIAATGDERVREVLASAASAISDDTGLCRRQYERDRREPDNGIFVKEYPRLSDDDWRLLDSYAHNRTTPIYEDYDGLIAIRKLLRDVVVEGRYPAIGSDARAALEEAERTIRGWLRTCDEEFRERDHDPYKVSDVMYVLGDADRSYLETVHWTRQPKDGDQGRYTELRSRLGRRNTEADMLETKFGYDMFGRMVIHSANYYGSEVYVVEWPVGYPEERYPDTVYIIADDDHSAQRGGRPVYLVYPDGTYDLLPIPPGLITAVPPFKWGYGGTGPGVLEVAIERACCSGIPESDRRGNSAWLESMISLHPPLGRLKIQVAEVRRWRKGEQSPEEYSAWRAGRGEIYAASHRLIPPDAT